MAYTYEQGTHSNVSMLVELGVFDVSGMTDMQLGRLEKNTRILASHNGRHCYMYDVYTHPEYVAKQYVPDSKYKYRLVNKSGAYLDIPKMVYDALTLPKA